MKLTRPRISPLAPDEWIDEQREPMEIKEPELLILRIGWLCQVRVRPARHLRQGRRSNRCGDREDQSLPTGRRLGSVRRRSAAHRG